LPTFCLDTYLSELAKSKNIHETSCSKGNGTESCPHSRYGTTFAPSTGSRGAEQLTFFAEDFRVKTSQQQERELALLASVRACGESMRDSLAKCGLSLSLPRTHRFCGSAGLTLCSETLPTWGIMLDGACWELGISVAYTGGAECGYLPTPRSCSAMGARLDTDGNMSEKRFPNLETIIAKIFLPTPMSSDNRDRGKCGDSCVQRRISIGKQVNLSQMLQVESGQYLNPAYVEEMMGWTIGWTDLKPLETDKFHKWLHSHSPSSRKD